MDFKDIVYVLIFALSPVGFLVLLRKPKLSLFMLVASFPFFDVQTMNLGGGFLLLSAQKVFGGLAVIFLVLDYSRTERALRFVTPQLVFSVILLFWLFVCFIYNDVAQLHWAQQFLSNLLFVFLVTNWMDDLDEVGDIVVVFLVMLAFSSFYSLITIGEAAFSEEDGRLTGTMLNANRAAQAYLLGSGLSIAWIFKNSGNVRKQILGIVFLIVFIYFMVLTASRSAVIGFTVMVSFLLLLNFGRPGWLKIVVSIVIAVSALSFLAPSVFKARIQMIPYLSEQGTEYQEVRGTRSLQYKLAFQLAEENPVFGIGPGMFKKYYSRVVEPVERGVHSWYLEMATNGGMPALILYVLLLLSSAWVFFSRWMNAPKEEDRLFASAMFSLSIGMMFFGVTSSEAISKLNFLLIGLGSSLWVIAKRKEELARSLVNVKQPDVESSEVVVVVKR